jgi:hypothetical protein
MTGINITSSKELELEYRWTSPLGWALYFIYIAVIVSYIVINLSKEGEISKINQNKNIGDFIEIPYSNVTMPFRISVYYDRKELNQRFGISGLDYSEATK